MVQPPQAGGNEAQVVQGKSQAQRQDTVSLNRTDSGAGTFHAIMDDKSALNDVAKIIQKVDTTMGLIGRNLDSMKADLSTIVKNFPPFPPGDAERVRLLKSYSSLRQQIDAMTIPRPPEDAGFKKIMADPSVTPDAGGISVTIGKSDATVTVAPQEVHSGPTGLNIPALSDSPPREATDGEVKQALAGLDTAKATLQQRQAGLAADAGVIGTRINDAPMFKRIFADSDLNVGLGIAQGKETGKNTDYSALATYGISGKSTQQIQSALI